MKNLDIEATEQTLEIHFNFEKEKLLIKGESYPENTLEFFEPIFSWINKYFSYKNQLAVEFEIEYLNSSSWKSIYDLFEKLGEYHDLGKSINVVWKYPADDEEILEDGEEFSEETSLNMTYEKI